MVNVILSSDNVTVLGGPTRLDVDLNVGAPGVRGSIIFTDSRNPNTLVPSRDFIVPPLIFDLFINSNPSSSDYLQAYQYINKDGNNVWVPIFKLKVDTFTVNKVLDFANGKAEIFINLTELGLENVPFDSFYLSSAYFNVVASFTLVNPSLLPEISPLISNISVLVKDAYYDSTGLTDPAAFPLILPIEFNGLELSGDEWVPIDEKQAIAYLNISITDPSEILQAFGGDS
jgi:hypothetical protein